MSLNLFFKRKQHPNYAFTRFKTAIYFFNELTSRFKSKGSTIAFYEYSPFDEELEQREFSLGILEPKLRKYLENVESQNSVGLFFTTYLTISDKEFEIFADLVPSGTQYRDMYFEVMPNAHAKSFEDLIKFKHDLRELLYDRITHHNSSHVQKISNITKIRKATLSPVFEEVSGISHWQFVYTEEFEDILEYCATGDPELRSYLEQANTKKFAKTLLENDNFDFILSDIMADSRVASQIGSIALFPSDANSMNEFTERLRKVLLESASAVYVPKDQYKKKISNVLEKQLKEIS